MSATTATPFHILMLPHGSSSSSSSSSNKPKSGIGNNDEKSASPPVIATNQQDGTETDDYLTQRREYRESKKKTKTKNESRTGETRTKTRAKKTSCNGDDRTAHENDESDDDNDGVSWSGASSLEIAIVDCCEVDGLDQINDDEEQDNDDEDNDDDDESEVYHGGAIASGKEGQFASLVAMKCWTAPERALALAVLERTIERDQLVGERNPSRLKKRKPEQKTRNEKDEQVSESERKQLVRNREGGNSNDETNVAKASKNEGQSDGQSDNDGGSGPTHEQCDDANRMRKFLSAGGLAILKQWLIDAYTPVPVSQPEPQQQLPHEQQRRRTRQASSSSFAGRPSSPRPNGGKSQTTASPTGPILLPLLNVLKLMPFDKELVIKETKINKTIRDLKKKLDSITEEYKDDRDGSDSDDSGRSSSSSSDSDSEDDVDSGGNGTKKRKRVRYEELTHPTAGGLPVVRVRDAVDSLMEIWKKAVIAASKNANKDEPIDYYARLRKRMKEGYDMLCKYEEGEGEKPRWLEEFDPTDSGAKAASAATVAISSGCDTAGRDGTTVMTSQKIQANTKETFMLKKQKEELMRDRWMREKEEQLKAAQRERLEVQRKMENYRKRMRERKEAEQQRKEYPSRQQQQQQNQERSGKVRSPRVRWKDEVTTKERGPLTAVHEFAREPEEDVYVRGEEEETQPYDTQMDDINESMVEQRHEDENNEDVTEMDANAGNIGDTPMSEGDDVGNGAAATQEQINSSADDDGKDDDKNLDFLDGEKISDLDVQEIRQTIVAKMKEQKES